MKEEKVIHPQNAAPSIAAKTTITKDSCQTEDAVMKTMLQYFADKMLPAFGISKKVKAYAPTEHVHIEINKGLQDFNLVMEDDSIAHFEFQSTNGGRRDLRRFRSYEADTSYQLQKPVTTYVLFSGRIRRPMTRILDGINTYKISNYSEQQAAGLRSASVGAKRTSTGRPAPRWGFFL